MTLKTVLFGTNLHSIMYLLILGGATNSGYPFSFTFHNVSINSPEQQYSATYKVIFTFHNVSINSLNTFI